MRRASKWEQIARYFPSRVVTIGYGYYRWLQMRARVVRWVRAMAGTTGRVWLDADRDRAGEEWETWTVARR